MKLDPAVERRRRDLYSLGPYTAGLILAAIMFCLGLAIGGFIIWAAIA